MFATVLVFHGGKTQVQQFEAPTVKDCLVAWAGRFVDEAQTDDARTRLRGDMADFAEPAIDGLGNVWRFRSDLGRGGEPEATVIVVETVRR